jgi:hypothetical protein
MGHPELICQGLVGEIDMVSWLFVSHFVLSFSGHVGPIIAQKNVTH